MNCKELIELYTKTGNMFVCNYDRCILIPIKIECVKEKDSKLQKEEIEKIIFERYNELLGFKSDSR